MNEKPLRQDAPPEDCRRMSLDDTFTFRCGPDLPCFTRCCSDVSIVLTPYDVLRLKNALSIDSTDFITRHTLTSLAGEAKIPVLLLKMGGETTSCPFVGERGCSVYANRPWACRMYPLGAAEPQNPNPEARPFYFPVHEDLCKGHGEGRTLTVREWIQDQGLEEYEMMGEGFKRLMLHPAWSKGEPLSREKAEMFFMACYDLDRFRRFVFDSRFLEVFIVDEARVEAIRTDDEELLDFAMQWLQYALFGEKSMKIRQAVLDERRGAEGAAAGPHPARP